MQDKTSPPPPIEPKKLVAFVNPYAHASDDLPATHPHRSVRLVSNITQEAYARVKQLNITRGVIQTTLNILWAKLLKQLDEQEIHDYTDSDRYCEFINNCELTLPRTAGTDKPTPPSGRTLGRSRTKKSDSTNGGSTPPAA